MKNSTCFTIFIFLLLATQTFTQSAPAIRVEPSNWWIGMKNPRLQLMVYADAVGETAPELKYPGVRIVKVHKAESKNYLFIDLLISPKAKPGSFNLLFRRNGVVAYTFPYSLLQRESKGSDLTGFTPSDVVYLITPDRFANGDERNDVIPGMRENKIDRKFDGARHGGDIRGIINNLDYIKDMGFTAIWPQPLLENDMEAYSYHGYSCTDYYKVDPRFGTLEEYKELAQKARQKGLKLIIDDVINHIGSEYWWMKDLPFRDWINYADDIQLTNHMRTVNQDPYASQSDKDLMTKGWFVTTMPDNNGSQPFYATYLIQHSIWWVETLQLGGIRQDTYPYSDKDFLKQWSCAMMEEYPNLNIVGEEWTNNQDITAYWQAGATNVDGYTSCLKTVMDFAIQEAVANALNEPESRYPSKGLIHLYTTLSKDFVYADPNNVMVFGDNHDMDRLFTHLNDDAALTKMALTYLLTIRGIPQIYYGTEILMSNTGHLNNHGVIRSDFPGGWKGDAVNGFTGQGLTPQQAAMQSYVKRLLNWRKNNPVIAKGKTLHFAPHDGIYVYFRYLPGQTIMVVLNKNAGTTKLDLGRFDEILKGKTSIREIFSDQAEKLSPSISVPGKAATVYEVR